MTPVLTNGLRILSSRLALLFSKGILTRVDDAGSRQKVDLQLLSDEVDTEIEHAQPYGFTAHPPPGSDLWALYFGGNRDHGIVFMIEDRQYRLVNLDQGDVALYDDKGQSILLNKDGITVAATKDVKILDGYGQEVQMVETGIVIKALNITIQKPDGAGAVGDVTIQADTATVNATKAVINSDDVNLGGEGGPAVARIGDTVVGGVITTGSSRVKAT